MFGYGYYGYFVFMLPALIIALGARIMVSTTFSKYSQIRCSEGLTGAETARRILDRNGLTGVAVMATKGKLTDNFNPADNTVYLSESVYASSSVAAVGVAAHESGHAIQHAVGYTPIKIRMSILPVCRFGSMAAPYLLLIGIIMNFGPFFIAGILFFALSTVFQIVTLPVEFNASHRAIEVLESTDMLSDDELKGAKNVLSAAAMTYVAALFTSLMQLLYYISRYSGRRK